MKRRITGLMALVVAGCVSSQAHVMPGTDFDRYQTAYIEALEEDEFNLFTRIVTQLDAMDLKVVNHAAPERPSPRDVVVTFSYRGGWDLGRYLRGFQIQFVDAQSDAIVASVRYEMEGAWASTDARVEHAFNELREKLGLEPIEPQAESVAKPAARYPAAS